MAYRVEFTPRAAADLDGLYEWVTTQAPYSGPLWFNRLENAICSLSTFPERCPVVEGLSTEDAKVRQLVFGRKKSRYAVYYIVLGDTVQVLHVRQGARDAPRRQDLLG